MDTLTPELQKPADDGNADENLKLQQQQKAATAVPSGSDPAPIPAPPPLPSTSPAPSAPASVAAPTAAAPPAPSVTPPPPTYEQAFANYQSATGDQAAGALAALNAASGARNTAQAATDNAEQLAGATNYMSVDDINREAAQGKTYSAFAGLPGVNYGQPQATGGGGGAGGVAGGATTNVAPIAEGPQLTFPGGTETPPTSAPRPIPGATPGTTPGTPILSARAPLMAPGGSASDVGAPSSGVGPKIGSAVPLTPPTSAAPFTANDVGIGSTILPNADPRLQNTQGMVDAAAKNLASVDRFKLAGDRFDTEAARTDPAYKLALRRATQSAAGAGRIGSGMLRTSYGDLGNQRALELDSLRKGFMQDALNGTISDSFNKFGALAGLENQQFGQGQATRGELRGERGYQGSLEQQAFERALGQYQTEQQDVKDRFARGTTLAGVGESGNPDQMYATIAAQLGMAPSAIKQLVDAMGHKSASTPAGIPPIPHYPNSTPPIVPGTTSNSPYPYE